VLARLLRMRDWPDGSVTIAFRETCEEAQTSSWGDTNEQRPTQTPSIPFLFRTLLVICEFGKTDSATYCSRLLGSRRRSVPWKSPDNL
jgi:hypothetical protein